MNMIDRHLTLAYATKYAFLKPARQTWLTRLLDSTPHSLKCAGPTKCDCFVRILKAA